MTQRIEVAVPDVGEYSNLPVIELLVAPGDRVEVDDPLLTIESDKATMDIPAPAAGTVAELRVGLGDEVSEGDVLLVLDAAGEGEAAAAPEAAPATEETVSDEAPEAEPAPEPEPEPEPDDAATAAEAAPEADDDDGEAESAAPGALWGAGDPRAPSALSRRPPPTAALGDAPAERPAAAHASPSVRRMARELGVDPREVTGTGRKGRVVADDVRRYVKERLAAPQAAAAGAPMAFRPFPPIDFSQFGETHTEQLSRIKRRTAANLGQAWPQVPLVTHFDESDVTDLDAFRRALQGDPDARGAHITLVPFAMKALVATLREFPSFNASLAPDGEHLIFKRYFNIAIAVDTPEGLVVPVIREVDRKDVVDLALELAEVSERTRARKLRPADLQGACITISSLGGIGGSAFTPLVNLPEVAILGLARTRVTPVWNGGEFVPRTMLPIVLSYDHRVIDGAEAARFCRHFTMLLADVRRLLL